METESTEPRRSRAMPDLTTPKLLYVGMLSGERAVVTAYLQEWNAGKDGVFHLFCTRASGSRSRRRRLRPDEAAEAAVLEAELTQAIYTAARAAAWDVITFVNDRQVQVTNLYPPWSPAMRPAPSPPTD